MNEAVLKKLAKPLIILATAIWGSSFVIMKNTIETVPALYLLAFRFLAAAAILTAVFFRRMSGMRKRCLIDGCVMGMLLLAAYTAQTYGLAGTTPGKNAFLTASYCIIVPFLNWAAEKKRPDGYNILAALLCVSGIGLVSLNAAFTVTQGDGLTLLGGFFYALHIIAVNRFAKHCDIFSLTVIQFVAAGALALVFALPFNTPPASLPGGAAVSLLYLAVACTALALLFQNIGQKYTEPAAASVLLSLEAPLGVLISVLIYAERPTLRMLLGFALIFFSVLCSETKLSFVRRFLQNKRELVPTGPERKGRGGKSGG